MADTVKKSNKATEITYTEKELEAIEILKAHKGEHLTAKELGISTAILTSLYKKAEDSRPMADGLDRVILNKADKEVVVEVEKTLKAYWID